MEEVATVEIGDDVSSLFVGVNSRNETPASFFKRNIFFPGGWNVAKASLKQSCAPEHWGEHDSVLHNYIVHVYHAIISRFMEELPRLTEVKKRDYQDGVHVAYDKRHMVINTGLVDPAFGYVYGFFERNKNEGQQTWVFKQWGSEYNMRMLGKFSILPVQFVFFRTFHEIYFNPDISLSIDLPHILQDDEKHGRLTRLFPAERSREVLAGIVQSAITRMEKRVRQNSRTVVPQYYNGEIQLLLPLSFPAVDPSAVQLVIPVSKREVPLPPGELRDPRNPRHWQYLGATVLDSAMAYNNARLLFRPESEWLTVDLLGKKDGEGGEGNDDGSIDTRSPIGRREGAWGESEIGGAGGGAGGGRGGRGGRGGGRGGEGRGREAGRWGGEGRGGRGGGRGRGGGTGGREGEGRGAGRGRGRGGRGGGWKKEEESVAGQEDSAVGGKAAAEEQNDDEHLVEEEGSYGADEGEDFSNV
eukprot:gene22520-27489_t